VLSLANLTPPDDDDEDVVELGQTPGLGFEEHSHVWLQYAGAEELDYEECKPGQRSDLTG